MNEPGKLIVMARSPQLGKVKTRLAATIGDEFALKFYEQLLDQTINTVTEVCSEQPTIFSSSVFYVDGSLGVMESLHADLTYQMQRGTDLGQRMLHAAQQELKESPWVIIIGTDCPALSQGYLINAALTLMDNNNYDVVVGPAEDGGYVLLGLHSMCPTIFSDMQWGNNQVYTTTINRLNKEGLSYAELSQLWDVDTLDDLRRWQDCSSSKKNQ